MSSSLQDALDGTEPENTGLMSEPSGRAIPEGNKSEVGLLLLAGGALESL